VIGRDALLAAVEAALGAVRAEHGEILARYTDSALTRFANNSIHQNTASTLAETIAVAHEGRKVGVASTTSLEREAVARAAERAAQIAGSSAESDAVPPIASAAAARLPGFDEATAKTTPAERARRVEAVTDAARSRGAIASGALSTALTETAYGNSAGTRQYEASTCAAFSAVVSVSSGSGYAASVSRSLKGIRVEALGKHAIQRALASRRPQEIEPETCAVILEPYAVATLISFLAYLGFGAKGRQEGTSCLAGKTGRKLFDEKLTILDDPLDGRGLPAAFDAQGVPKRKMTLVEKGKILGPAYDLATAAKDAAASTGHGLGPSVTLGPLPTNLMIEAGDSPLSRIIASVEKGIYVTRLHYVNVADPASATLTGMTRDGTFLIKDGKLGSPLKNLRFTQSVLEALASITAISKERWPIEDMLGPMLVPAIALPRFRFTGASEF